MRSMNDMQRLLVVDEKLRILYASDTLAKMLGATVTALTSLNMTSLIPPPAAQLHKRWVTVSGEAISVHVCDDHGAMHVWCVSMAMQRLCPHTSTHLPAPTPLTAGHGWQASNSQQLQDRRHCAHGRPQRS
jgi:hypothetical protein